MDISRRRELAFAFPLPLQSQHPMPSLKQCKTPTRKWAAAPRCTLDVRIESKTVKTQAPLEQKCKWDGMKLKFITLELTVANRNSEQLRLHIESRLAEHGDPVRWAVVQTDDPTDTVRVDAVVSN